MMASAIAGLLTVMYVLLFGPDTVAYPAYDGCQSVPPASHC